VLDRRLPTACEPLTGARNSTGQDQLLGHWWDRPARQRTGTNIQKPPWLRRMTEAGSLSRRELTTAVTTTQTTARHQQHRKKPGRDADQGVERAVARFWGPRVTVIIVSEPSAEAPPRVRIERSSPARSRSSAAHNDTPRHTDAWPISVHTEEISGDQWVQIRGWSPITAITFPYRAAYLVVG
jgi:hypothetical protein